jgi:hypothetical protein
MISLVLSEYDLITKVLSVTLDNASANASAIDYLTPSLSSYVGSTVLHRRCACHIINLIVKFGLKRLKMHLEDFRIAISFLNSSNQRIASFKSFCLAAVIRPHKFGLDIDVRWNSTYLMLKDLLPYKDTFSVFIHTNYRGASGTLLTPDHWYVAEHILQFLEQFYLSTVSLSGIYYPTAPLMMHVIIEIADHLNQFKNDSLLRDVIVPMKTKFLKYWLNIPLLYSFAFILDPRAKLTGFNSALQVLSELLNHDYCTCYIEVKSELGNMFAKYESKFDSLRLQSPSQPSAAPSKQPSSWNRIFYGAASVPSFSSRPSPASCTISELSSYLDSDSLNQYDESFSVLNWWQDHKRTYPILSVLTKDIITIPVSTISSESAFSLSGILLDDRHRSLTPAHVERLSLIKDWEQADARQQHNMENKDLEEMMKNMFLDDAPTADAAGSSVAS